MRERGFIQVYTGNGKGKSTAAIGQAVRAAGHGHKVGFISFFKDPDVFGYGEYRSMQQLGIKTFLFARKHPHFYKTVDHEEVCRECVSGLECIKELLLDPSWDMLVLDELNIALRDGFVNEDEVISLLDAKPQRLELVLTGRGVPQRILDRADLVSEVMEIKHPYSQGIQSREGIEY